MANSRPPAELDLWGDVTVVRQIPQANRASITWEVDANGTRAVAKLTFDAPPKVEPGLRVAEAVEAATGIPTGKPLRRDGGTLVAAVGQPNGRVWTLAVLLFVEGIPLTTFTEESAAAAGDVLGRVHQATRSFASDTVPARLLDWFRDVGGSEVEGIADQLDALPLTLGVVYGDPGPELVTTESGAFALIDWGTPSYGPMIYDLATWEMHARRWASTDEEKVAVALRDAYRAAGPCVDDEYAALPLCAELWRWLTESGA